MNFHTVYFLAAKFAYNNAERGISYEYQTIFRSLEDIGTPVCKVKRPPGTVIASVCIRADSVTKMSLVPSVNVSGVAEMPRVDTNTCSRTSSLSKLNEPTPISHCVPVRLTMA